MSFRRFAAAVLLALSPAAAQAPLPTLRIEPTTGGSIFYIKNTYSQPVTAYMIEMLDYPGSYYSLLEDLSEGVEIPAGAEIRKPISNMTVGAVPDYVKMQAAVFADGSTAGIPEKITLILERRRATLAAIRGLIARVEKGQAAEGVRAELKQWSDGLPPIARNNMRSQVAINQSATRNMISKTSARLATDPLEKVLTDLRALERFLAASKPAL